MIYCDILCDFFFDEFSFDFEFGNFGNFLIRWKLYFVDENVGFEYVKCLRVLWDF